MCLTCGCGDEENVRVSGPGATKATADFPTHAAGHSHAHTHGHHHGVGHHHDPSLGHDSEHSHSHAPAGSGREPHALLHQSARTEKLVLGEQILAKNDHLAEHNRSWLRQRDIVAVNLMSSPGSGKTTLLERTIGQFAGRDICVVEGDQETVFDAERIEAAGARAVQVNTGAGCHLDAPMVADALHALEPSDGTLLFIENVGNLVCPALFDLGERAKVVVISVTEGDDKPLKYPHMFAAADLVVVNKTDLLPYVDFDLSRLTTDARKLNPALEVLALSARTGENMPAWHDWIRGLLRVPTPDAD